VKHNQAKHFETPDAVRHDAHTLAEDAQALLDATRETMDEKVQAARERLSETIEQSREMYSELQQQVVKRARKADETIHEHPYQTAFMAMGVGAMLGFILSRRN